MISSTSLLSLDPFFWWGNGSVFCPRHPKVLLKYSMSQLRPNCAAASEILSIPKFGSGIGLHRMLWATDQIPNQRWLHQLDALKVTGSKGKGSTSALCASILS